MGGNGRFCYYIPMLSEANRDYFPPSEHESGWRVSDPASLGVDVARLNEAINYHDSHETFTQKYGGALVIIHKGHIIGESYVTGVRGGPQPWTANTCNDMKSSTKSVFGTAVGVFLEEYGERVNLDTLLVGTSLKIHSSPKYGINHSRTSERKRLKSNMCFP